MGGGKLGGLCGNKRARKACSYCCQEVKCHLDLTAVTLVRAAVVGVKGTEVQLQTSKEGTGSEVKEAVSPVVSPNLSSK